MEIINLKLEERECLRDDRKTFFFGCCSLVFDVYSSKLTRCDLVIKIRNQKFFLNKFFTVCFFGGGEKRTISRDVQCEA